MTKQDLYAIGVQAAQEFLRLNSLKEPKFSTYEEAMLHSDKWDSRGLKAADFLRRVVRMDGRTVGSGTGLYYDGYVFVNVPRTAAPVQHPVMRQWSWPGWKTDRTAIGVVAHEVGHYVEHRMQLDGKLTRENHREEWFALCKHERVSGYEPVPAEAWAETLRLFILNPALLRAACPRRYTFVDGCGLKATPRLLRKGWRKVLGNSAYDAAAERWIGVSH